MLFQKRRGIAQNIGTIVAYDLFVSMLNPKYRGKNFDWNLDDSIEVWDNEKIGYV